MHDKLVRKGEGNPAMFSKVQKGRVAGLNL